MMIMVIVFSNMFRFDIQDYPVYLIINQSGNVVYHRQCITAEKDICA